MFTCSCILSLQSFLLWFDGSDGVGLAGRSCLSLPVPAGRCWARLSVGSFSLGQPLSGLQAKLKKHKAVNFSMLYRTVFHFWGCSVGRYPVHTWVRGLVLI